MRSPQFPGNRFGAPRLFRLGSRQRGFAPICSRHVLWAGAITAKFARGKGSVSWQTATMVQARIAGAGNLSLQAFLTQNFFTQNLAAQTRPAAQAAGTIIRLPGVSQRVFVETQLSRAERRVETDKPDQGRIQLFSPGPAQKLSALPRTDGDLLPSAPIGSRMPTAMTLAAKFGNNRPARFLPLEESDEPEWSPAGSMALRITKRHRRVEEHGFRYRQDLAIDEPRMPASDMTIVAGRKVPRRQQEPDIRMEADSSKRSATPKPVVDTTRITDEVLKQLDRRLIAARERMGKI